MLQKKVSLDEAMLFVKREVKRFINTKCLNT